MSPIGASARLQAFWAFGGPASIVFAARLAGAAVMIGVQLALAYLAGADQLGLFFFATSAATVAAVFAAGGYPNIVVKIVTGGRVARGRAAALARCAIADIAVASVCIFGLIAVASAVATHAAPVLVAAAAIPIMAWGRLLNAFAVAHNRPVLANLPNLLGRPLIIGSGLAILELADVPIDAVAAAWLFVAGVAVPIAFLTVVMIRAGLLSTAPVDRRLRRLFRATAFPLVGVSALTALIGDMAVITSGLFLAPAALGVFALALKVALLIGFLIQTIHQIGMPKIAAAHSLGRTEGFRLQVVRTNRSAFVFAFAAALILAAMVPAMQSWLGEEFFGGPAVLAVLIAAQLARAYFGPSVPALVLVSANRFSSMLSLLTTFVLIAAMALLAPRYGGLGAALALSSAMLAWSAAAAVVAARRGLNTTGLGLRKSKPVAPSLPVESYRSAA